MLIMPTRPPAAKLSGSIQRTAMSAELIGFTAGLGNQLPLFIPDDRGKSTRRLSITNVPIAPQVSRVEKKPISTRIASIREYKNPAYFMDLRTSPEYSCLSEVPNDPPIPSSPPLKGMWDCARVRTLSLGH